MSTVGFMNRVKENAKGFDPIDFYISFTSLCERNNWFDCIMSDKQLEKFCDILVYDFNQDIFDSTFVTAERLLHMSGLADMIFMLSSEEDKSAITSEFYDWYKEQCDKYLEKDWLI